MSDLTNVPVIEDFKLEPPFTKEFTSAKRKYWTQPQSPDEAIIALYGPGPHPMLFPERRYRESVKAGRILTLAEFDAILSSEPLKPSPMQTIFETAKEPLPPMSYVRRAEHHWLDEYDSDGHYHGRIVLQWNPGAQRWSHSGMLATNSYINTKFWKYVGHCPMPE